VSIAVISLSNEGARLAAALAAQLPPCQIHLHAQVTELPAVPRFERICELTQRLFSTHRGLIYIAPTGVVVRAISPCLAHKTSDPAVVAVDVGGRWAISLLSGHEGGANELAITVSNILAAEPVISTSTEALKTLIVGIGCRRGVPAQQIVTAVYSTLAMASVTSDRVRLLASASIKADEPGLLAASRQLGIPLRLISADELRQCPRNFARSAFVQKKVNLPAVAEPAALLAGRRTRLLVPKQTFSGVTVAVAQESCMWSA